MRLPFSSKQVLHPIQGQSQYEILEKLGTFSTRDTSMLVTFPTVGPSRRFATAGHLLNPLSAKSIRSKPKPATCILLIKTDAVITYNCS